MREHFNLFKLRVLVKFIKGGYKDNWFMEFVLDDTFGRFICNKAGHSKRNFDAGSGGREVWCERCTRFIYQKDWDVKNKCYKKISHNEYMWLNLK